MPDDFKKNLDRFVGSVWLGGQRFAYVGTGEHASLFPVGMLEDGPANEPQVRGFIVGSLEQLALLHIVPSGLRQRIEHRCIADAQPQVAQQITHHIFGRHAVYLCEQVGEPRTLLFDRSLARRLRDGFQAKKHVVDTEDRGDTPFLALHLPGD